jgi:hypothetical protein
VGRCAGASPCARAAGVFGESITVVGFLRTEQAREHWSVA